MKTRKIESQSKIPKQTLTKSIAFEKQKGLEYLRNNHGRDIIFLKFKKTGNAIIGHDVTNEIKNNENKNNSIQNKEIDLNIMPKKDKN